MLKMEKTKMNRAVIIIAILTAVLFLVSMHLQYSNDAIIRLPTHGTPPVRDKEVRADTAARAKKSGNAVSATSSPSEGNEDQAIITQTAKDHKARHSTGVTIKSQPTEAPKKKIAAPSQAWIRSNIAKLCQTNSLLNCNMSGTNAWNATHKIGRVLSFYSDRLRVVMTAIPKTGCTSWKSIFLQFQGKLKLNADNKLTDSHGKVWKGGPNEQVHAMMYAMEVRYSQNITKFSDYFTFGFVRNPWVRLVSCYRDKVMGHFNQLGRAINMYAAKRRTGEEHPDYRQYTATIEEMLLYLINTPHIDRLNTHIRPLTLILGIPVIQYDYLLPVEHINTQIEPVLEYLRAHSNVKEVSVGRGYDQRDDERDDQRDDPQLASSVVSAREWLSGVDQELIDKVYKIYENDFKILNYSNFSDPNFPYPLNYVD